MNISGVQTQLSSDDLISIINEFVKVEGLEIENIILDNSIDVYGKYTSKFSISFEVSIEILSIKNGIIKGKFSKCKISGFGFFRPVRSLALKYINKKLQEIGINTDVYKDSIEIDTNAIINTIPFINLNIDEIYIKGNKINIEVSNIEISLAGDLVKEKTSEVEKEEDDDELILPVKKVEDKYTKGRKKLEKKFDGKLNVLHEYVLIVPDIVALIYRLLKDERVKIKTKLEISAAVAYIIFPIDIIPEFIPFIGKIDDVAVLFFALNRIINEVPINIIAENWAGKNDLVVVLKKAVEFLNSYTNSSNVDKLYDAVVELTKL
ncbi:YkvA family protein [Clostridium sp. HCP1S3_B4]|uniref:YkvA family protein n=1 Tax=unclassified Clostridium TaxID=2614128 RepID=UPI0016A2010E|nr:YkvA family protein [Clostridiales bacterium]MDY2729413.1 YkvA family protein [Clostridium sp.]NLK23409.1 DUF1232 domain-containing protein [Clostridiales bacterium]